MSGNKPCKSVLWSCADFSRSGIRVFACPVESMSNEITNMGLSVAFAVNICALLSVLMDRYRTVRKEPTGRPLAGCCSVLKRGFSQPAPGQQGRASELCELLRCLLYERTRRALIRLELDQQIPTMKAVGGLRLC